MLITLGGEGGGVQTKERKHGEGMDISWNNRIFKALMTVDLRIPDSAI